MKSDIHPEYGPVVFKDGEHEVITQSTMTSEETREIDGVEHDVVHIDISAFTHPFYTGQKKLVDTEGRVDRFLERYDMDGDDDEEEEAEASDGDDADEAEAEADDEPAEEADADSEDDEENS